MAYIRMDKDLIDDPRVLRLADLASLNEILGGLYRLWRYADTHVTQDTLHVRHSDLITITGLASQVLKALPSQWLVENADGSFTLPGYTAKNVLNDKEKRREQTRVRTENWRRRKRDAGDASHASHVTTSQRHKPSPPKTGTETGTTGTGTGIEEPASEPAPGTADAAPAPRPAALTHLLQEIKRKRTLRAESRPNAQPVQRTEIAEPKARPQSEPNPVDQAKTAEPKPRPETKPTLQEENEIRADAMRLQAMRRRYGIP